MTKRVDDQIFTGIFTNISNGLTPSDGEKFSTDIEVEIAVNGKDWSLVHWQLIELVLRDLPEVDGVSQAIIEGISSLAGGGEWSMMEAYAAAEDAAYAGAAHLSFAAYAAAYASHAAAYTASAHHPNAFDRFRSAERASDAAANAARYATNVVRTAANAAADFTKYNACFTRYVAYTDACKRQAEIMLELLKNAPVAEVSA